MYLRPSTMMVAVANLSNVPILPFDVIPVSRAEERVMPAEVKVLGWKKGKRRGIVVRGAGGPWHKDGGGTVRVGGQELAQDETQGFGSPVSSWSDAERFEELQKKYFGDKVLPSNGAEFIREAREARDAQLEGIV